MWEKELRLPEYWGSDVEREMFSKHEIKIIIAGLFMVKH